MEPQADIAGRMVTSDKLPGDMERLNTTINRVAEEVSALQARIGPVLSPQIEEPYGEVAEIDSPQSPLGHEIDRIDRIGQHLARIRDYVAL
jgi:hypothetical protein